MNKNILILLFVTIFYNGVTHSSPIDGQVSDAKVSEEMPPTVSPPTVIVNHLNKKPDPIAANISQNVSSVVQPVSEVPITKGTAPPDPKTSTTNLPTGDVKNMATDAGSKINIHVIDNNSDKSKNQTTDVKNTNQTTDNKNGGKPAEAKIETTTAPMDKKATENSTANPAGPTLISTAATGVPNATTTTLKPPVIKPTVSTVAPASSTKDNVIAEQNTPAPAQEKHFDGPSFIGGIVLTIGVTAIGFIAFKYYKSGKIDMNYRTL